jgi:magnesium transporter
MTSDARQNIFDEPVVKHVDRDFCAVRDSYTVGQAVVTLREHPPAGQFFYIYVLDAEQRLVGVLPTRALLFSPQEVPIAELMVRKVVKIPAGATVMDACEFFIQHRLLAMPVVDDQGKMLGIVDVNLFTEEVFDLAEEQSRDDVFQLIGIHVIDSQQVAPWTGFRDRFPWLVANFTGGAICALLASRFENLLAAVVAVSLFVPIVLNLSESVAIQSMSILLQGLHSRRVDRRFLFRALVRELAVAALLGTAAGVVVGLAGGIWLGSPALGFALLVSVALAIVGSGLLGLVLPVAIRALRADPRIASGPITLATADVLTLLVYFSVSMRLLI